MKRTPDVELVLRDYFADDGLTAPDFILDDVEARIGRQPQRRSWRLLWRSPMSTPLKLAASLAAIAIVAVIGWQLLPGQPDIGGQQTPPPATTVPTATLIPSGPPSLAEGILAAGTYRLRPFDSATLTIDVTVPDGGWTGGVPSALGGPRGESNGPNGVAIAFFKAQTIHSDPCHWDQDRNGSAPDVGDVEVGPTVDDLAAALAASSTYESTTPVDATLGGFSGKRLELQLAPDASGCDTTEVGENQYFVFGGHDGGFFAQGDANRWQVTIVDVDGTRLIAVQLSYAETSGDDLSAAQGILDSAVITP